MIHQTFSECPETDILELFLRGKLQPPQLDHCESHLKDCEQCHETLAGLNSEDTLTERLSDLLQDGPVEIGDEGSEEARRDSTEIKNLLGHLTSDDFKRSAMAAGPDGGHRTQTAQMEMVADRAAEILRCVMPDVDSLGILGDYKLIRLIGAGSTGVVFQALDQPLNRTVALKVLRPSLGEDARTRFLTEAKLAASIEHANVVTIFQVGQVDRLAFMAMQWLPGQTLDSLLISGEQLDDEQIVEIIRQVAMGLSAAHQKQLVHRDIKPANLWICEEDQQLKLLDFGLARINDGNHNLTATGMLAGTPGFMSPEQTRGLELDGRSDLFSLGCVLYRLLSGQLPFDRPSILATLSSIQTDHPAAPVEINGKADQNLSDLAMCLLAKQPEDRPQSASKVVELLTTPREQWSLAVPTHSNSLRQHAGSSRPQTAAKTANGSGSKWSTWILALVGLSMLGVLGWFAPQIIRIATDQGEIVIEASDDDVEVQVLQDGKVVRVIDTKTQQSFSLKSGQYSFSAAASDSAETGEKGNSFTIEPETLTMKRGETVIVSVSVKPNQNTNSQVASDVKNESITKNKPIYEGNTFAQWLKILQSNRDEVAQAKALEACLAIMETEQEQRQILDGARVFIKTLDRKFRGHFFSGKIDDPKSPKARYNNLLLRVLDSCDPQISFAFFKTEIESGTDLSQQLLFNWFKSHDYKIPVLTERYRELADPFAENLDKQNVAVMASVVLLDGAARNWRSMKQFQRLTLGKNVKELVQTGTPEQRISLIRLAFRIFPDDPEMLLAYQNDLLNPKLNDTWYVSGGLEQIRHILLRYLIGLLEADGGYYESWFVDAKTKAQRISTTTDWSAKVIDGILADGNKKLLFKRRLVFGGMKTCDTQEVADKMLQSIHIFGSRKIGGNNRRLLLSKLELLKERIAKEMKPVKDGKKLSYTQEEITRTLADLDYVIAVYQGNTPAKLPPESKLKLIAVPPTVSEVKTEPAHKSEPAVKNKPIFEGNTFGQWFEILESNRDYKSQAKALEACLAIMQTEKEQKQILEGARVFIKSLDRKFGATAFSKTSFLYYQHQAREKDRPKAIVDKQADLVRFHELLIRVLNSCDQSLVFDFFKTEIQGNTRLSQQILWNWLRGPGRSGNSRMIKDRYVELVNPFAENFEKRLVRAMTGYIVVSAARKKHQSLTRLQESALGVKIKEFVQTQTPAKRIEVLDLAFGIFPDDPQVFETYQEDLLDPKLNDVFVDLSRGGPRNWIFAKSVHARTKLFTFVQEHIWDKQYYEDPNVNAKTRKQRLATAADSLAKVVGGLVTVGDRQLEFTRNWAVIRGERETRAYEIYEMTALFLDNICNIRSASNDPKVKQLLLTKLQELKESILKEEVKRELSDLEKKERTQTLAELDYAIAVFQGNTSAERPPNSKLRIRNLKESE